MGCQSQQLYTIRYLPVSQESWEKHPLANWKLANDRKRPGSHLLLAAVRALQVLGATMEVTINIEHLPDGLVQAASS